MSSQKKGRKNKLVVFEGMDGVGKSTQARRLAEKQGALFTKQPGGSELAEPLRHLALDPDNRISDFAEALIFSLDRAIHTESVLLPALSAGKDIVCDRFVGSFLAYQAYGRKGDLDFLADLSRRATSGLEPDLVILLWKDKSYDAGGKSQKDRIEAEGEDFHKRVMNGYLNLLEANPRTWVKISADGSEQEVAEKIDALVKEKLNWQGKYE